MQKFLKGQRIQLEGVIMGVSKNGDTHIQMRGDNGYTNILSPEAMRYAKIIAEPIPKFSKEQIAAIEKLVPRDAYSPFYRPLYEFLDANTE